jgi:hypothetical protein
MGGRRDRPGERVTPNVFDTPGGEPVTVIVPESGEQVRDPILPT